MSKKYCLVTGASSGIGAALAKRFAQAGWDLVLTARDEERLNHVAGEITTRHPACDVVVLPFDLSDPRTPRRLAGALENHNVTGLINNAGFAPGPDFLGTPWTDHLGMLQVMLAAPTELVHLFAPRMKAAGYGRILNVGSVVGLMPAAGEGSLYAPVKSYVIKFSEAMAAQLSGTGIHVTALCPGLTRTEIFERSGTDAIVKDIPDLLWQTPEQVADLAYAALEQNRTVLVTGGFNKFQSGFLRALPEGLARRLMRAVGGQLYKNDTRRTGG